MALESSHLPVNSSPTCVSGADNYRNEKIPNFQLSAIFSYFLLLNFEKDFEERVENKQVSRIRDNPSHWGHSTHFPSSTTFDFSSNNYVPKNPVSYHQKWQPLSFPTH